MVELRGERVLLRTVVPADISRLHQIRETPPVRRWWGPVEPDWPSSEGDTVRLAILVGAQIVGFIQYHEDTSAEFKHAGVDLFLDPSVHRQGLGRESIDLVVRHLIDNLGHHRIVIDPAAANEAAIRCYESLGFRPVGIMREYWWDHTQDAWTDGLLLDLLASEVLP